jgi:poly(3-hydroxybutyrate) depolymerase
VKAVVLVVACLAGAASAADRLAGQHADARRFTVSGLSSGGYMAIQLQVAHSQRIQGVAALAAGPYYCAQGGLWTAYYNCATPGTWTPLPATQVLKAAAQRFAREGGIDSPVNLAAARIWLFSGSEDRTVARPVIEAAAQFYAAFGAKNIPIHSRPAGHAMVTDSAGAACGTTGPPYIVDCDYDAAGALLAELVGPLKPPADKAGGRLTAFDQKAFAQDDAYAISMADVGYVYVPPACAGERCAVHVAFHGCRQNADAVGERFVREAGYNRWADTNRLIVLYPQTIARYLFTYNPRGCWDWWGYTGAQYATKSAPQIRAVMAMVDRLGAPRSNP